MATPAPPLSPRRRLSALLLGSMLMLAAMLRLAAPAAELALDAMLLPTPLSLTGQTDAPRTGRSAAADFPGSAYFYAEDAFGPVVAPTSPPGADDSPHVYAINPGPQAAALQLDRLGTRDRQRAQQCLTNVIYYEAGNEPEEGQRAVAQVVLNRVASPLWPNSVCAVIYQGGERSDRRCQFTFSCDGSMARVPVSDKWLRAWRVAQRALGGEVFGPAGLATFYHTLAVRPVWSGSVEPVAVIGAHIFYRLPGRAGQPAAFGAQHAGYEYTQPGPYAFRAPPRGELMLPPAGPLPAWLSDEGATAAIPVAAVTTEAGPPPRAASFHDRGENAPAPGASPGLPISRVRPEYLNSGRPVQ